MEEQTEEETQRPPYTTMLDAWQLVEVMLQAKGGTEGEVAHAKKAFYAGAAFVLQTMESPIPTGNALREHIAGFHLEIINECGLEEQTLANGSWPRLSPIV